MRLFILGILLVLSYSSALAQHEDSNWHFGIQAAVSFVSGAPVVQATAMRTYEAASSISDGAGQLLFYSNGEKVWNRTHALMPNGGALAATGASSTQGALIVPHPGDPTLYYLFLTDDMEDQLALGCRYVLVDMKLAGGLGDVVGSPVRLPTPSLSGKVSEKLTAVRHANGRDYWIVVHGWESDTFFSFLVTNSGLVTSPVASSVGPVLDGVGGQSPYSNAAGQLRASPDGRHLAMASLFRDFGLYDFDPATGQVSNYVDLTPSSLPHPGRYGVEFSADNSRLYLLVGSPNLSFALVQFDMLAGAGSRIARSGQVVGTGNTNIGGLLRAPTGKIYLAGGSVLHAINQPNALGADCQFQLNALSLNGAVTPYTLPNQVTPHSRNYAVQVAAGPVCLGAPTAFSSQLLLPSPPLSATWNFGDGTTGPGSAASGPSAVHTYAAPGTYTATLSVTVAGYAGSVVGSQQVLVNAVPTVALGDSVQQICAGQTLLLQPSPQPAGSSYRWQDGSTAPTFTAQAAGRYVVEVTTPAGCRAQAATTVKVLNCPVALPPTVLIPNIITPEQDAYNQTFTLQGLHAPDWALHLYNRWGREVYAAERYDDSWAAQGQPAGVYYYLLSNAQTGQRLRGWVEVVK